MPLIDREIFFDNPEIAAGQISPDGKYISFLRPYNNILNIYVKKIDEPFKQAKLLTKNERPIAGYLWTDDSKYILYANDRGGNENYNIYAVNPSAKIEDGSGIPENRNLILNDKVRAVIYSISKKNPDELTIGLNNRDAQWHDIYKLSISTGKLTKLYENKERILSWIFDWNEKPRIAIRNAEDGKTEFLKIGEDGKFTKIYEVAPLESAYPIGFTSDNAQVYISTNKNVNFTQLQLLNPETGSTTFIEEDPLKKVDLEYAAINDLSHNLEHTRYYDEKPRKYFKDKNIEAVYKYLQNKFPGKEIDWISSTKDQRKLLISVSSDIDAPEIYTFDRDTKNLIFQYASRPKLKEVEKNLSPMKSIRYKSSDGLEIQAYLTIPKNSEGKKLPLLVMPHGGPQARDYWGINNEVQMFVNRGFIVLNPNFRGSTGFGKKFLDAGNLQWGKLMQDDITWGVKYLIDKGLVDKSRVAILGGSYGGYATLAGLAFTPDMYAAGVDIVGPSNLFTLLASIPPYWEAARKQLALRIGDENTDAGKKILHDASPLFSTDKIKAPLMIVQGANDPRVNKAESDQIVVALRNKGTNVTYILADDEGHGFHKPVNNLGMLASAEKFLAQYCGTRYQESMSVEVAKRLKENTVDISTVSLTKKSTIALLKEMPNIPNDLVAGEYKFKGSIEVQGQKITFDMNRSVVKNGSSWEIADNTNIMGQSIKAIANFEQKKLNSISQSQEQGPMKINIEYQPGNVELKMDLNGNLTHKSFHPDGLCMADASGLDLIIAHFPISTNYSTSFYTIDAQTTKLKKYILNVLGNEIVHGINTTVVKLTNDEKNSETITYYIDLSKQIVLKGEAILPSMMNAKLTFELQ